MDTRIKEIVEACQIHEKKVKLYLNQARMFSLERMMADLVLNREVGMYANKLAEKDRTEDSEKILRINNELLSMEDADIILKYKSLKEEYDMVKETLGEYAKSINILLRKELASYNLPSIYIYQQESGIPISKNIIDPLVNNRECQIMIYPVYTMKSNREFRHFYNKVSFKYLEALSEDYDFDIESKPIGKIRVKKM